MATTDNVPFTAKDVAKVNPALAEYFKQLSLNPVKVPGDTLASGVVDIVIGNTCAPVPNSEYNKWTCYVKPQSNPELIGAVEFKLHPTFKPQEVVCMTAPYEITRTGWGVFTIPIEITDVNGVKHVFKHQLSFDNPNNQHSEKISVVDTMEIGVQTRSDDKKAGIRRMSDIEKVNDVAMHGHLGDGKGWAAPILRTFCDVEARKGYNTMKAHEYGEDPVTLRIKVKEMARLLRKAKHCVAYTGAGISTASGIDDYASQSKQSVATGTKAKFRVKKKSGLDAEPTFAHYTMAALSKAGYLKHWVQQNHDGLPQKAGFPQQDLNEIHGAWFDPSNPVVPMSGSLRSDLFKWMLVEEQAADLVLTLGTSLCGMNADRMVETAGKKYVKKGKGLGAIIIGFQRTQLDHLASLRIFASIDEVMLLLAIEMKLPYNPVPYTPSIPEEAKTRRKHVYKVPYDPATGMKSDKLIQWNLSKGAKITLTAGPGKGFKGHVTHTPNAGEVVYTVQFPCTREGSQEFGKFQKLYCLGTWFIEGACKGILPQLPVVNTL